METKLLIKTKKGNHYLQDIHNNYLIFIPPVFKNAIMSYDNDGGQVEDYYRKKYQFIRDSLSDDMKFSDMYSGRITANYIRKQVINLSQITFEVTDKCNLKCKYCAYGELYNDYDTRENRNLEFEDAKALIDHIAKYWNSEEYPSINKTIAIGFYGGEPLINIELIKQIISYLENMILKCINFVYVMTTNGILLDKHIDYLVSKEFIISISLDGNKSNNKYRTDKCNESQFDKIFKNAKLIQERYNDYFKTNVNFLSVLHNENSVSDIVDFIKTEFDKIPSIAEVNPIGISNDKIDMFKQMFQNKKESLEKAEDPDILRNDLFINDPETRSLLSYIHTFSGNVVRDYAGFFVENEKRNWIPTGTCVPFSKKIFLTVNGKILPCERIGHQFNLGTIDSGNVFLDYEHIAEVYNGYLDQLKTQCSSCYRVKGCLLCIFNIETLGSTLRCDQYFGINKIKVNLSKDISLLEKRSDLYNKIMNEVTIE